MKLLKVIKGAKIRNRYNQVPHLTQDTNGKVTNSQLYITNESQEVSPFPAGDHKAQINRRTQSHNKHKTEKNIKYAQKSSVVSWIDTIPKREVCRRTPIHELAILTGNGEEICLNNNNIQIKTTTIYRFIQIENQKRAHANLRKSMNDLIR